MSILTSLCVALAWGADEPKSQDLQAQGRIAPAQRSLLASAASGRVAKVLVKEGQAVKHGEVLVQLELRREEAELRRAEALFEGAKTRLKLAEVQYERIRKLVADRVASVEEGERARAEAERAKAEYDVARAELEQAKDALDAATVRAPFDGVVLKVNVEIGAFTNPANFGLVQAAGLVELADVSTFYVETAVREGDLAKIAVGQRCELALESAPKLKLTGKVERIAPRVDRGLVPVRVKLDRTLRELNIFVDMTASVKFVAGE